MATQTYCVRADIEAIIGEAAVLASIDDDQLGTEGATEGTQVTNAIARAAVEINSMIRHQYKMADVTGNEWLKWANASLAAYYLRGRRNNPVEQSVVDACIQIREMLLEIRWGRSQLPDQNPSFDHTATVSNFKPELAKLDNPIRVDTYESTGQDPPAESGRKRNKANQWGIY